MRVGRSIPFAAALLAATLSAPGAFAQDEDRGNRIGFGIETTLTTTFIPAGALALSYDAGRFRIDGLLGLLFIEDNSTSFLAGGRFFFVVHHTKSADFALGGGLSLGFVNPAGPGESQIRIGLEGGGQLRVFLANDFAINATAGLGIGLGDGPFVFGLGGQLMGSVGVIYYF